MIITAEIKDLILRHYVDNNEIGTRIDLGRDEKIHGIGGNTLKEILRKFGRDGLIRIDKTGIESGFSLNVEANDLVLEGGYHGRFQMFQASVEKLLTEVDKLDAKDVKAGNELKTIRMKLKDYLDIISKVSTLANNFGDAI